MPRAAFMQFVQRARLRLMFIRAVFELGKGWKEFHYDIAGCAVALLGDDALCVLHRLFLFHDFSVAM